MYSIFFPPLNHAATTWANSILSHININVAPHARVCEHSKAKRPKFIPSPASRFYENTHKNRVGVAQRASLRGVPTQKACAACKHIITERKLQFGAWFKFQKVKSRVETKNFVVVFIEFYFFFFPLTLSLEFSSVAMKLKEGSITTVCCTERRTSKVQKWPAR